MRIAQPSLRLVEIPVRWSLDEIHLIFRVSGVQDASFELWHPTLGFPAISFQLVRQLYLSLVYEFASTRIPTDVDLAIYIISSLYSCTQ